MIEWLWESVLLTVRVFVILSILSMIGAALGWLLAWWNGDWP